MESKIYTINNPYDLPTSIWLMEEVTKNGHLVSLTRIERYDHFSLSDKIIKEVSK